MSETPDLPARVVVGKNGAYWRDYGDGSYSMAVVSEDNDPVVPVAVYIPENAPDEEATPAGDRDWPTILAWWQNFAHRQGIRAERVESVAARPSPAEPPAGDLRAVCAFGTGEQHLYCRTHGGARPSAARTRCSQALRQDVEWLVDDSIRRGAISVGRGAEILGIGIRDMRAIGVRYRDEAEG